MAVSCVFMSVKSEGHMGFMLSKQVLRPMHRVIRGSLGESEVISWFRVSNQFNNGEIKQPVFFLGGGDTFYS